MTLQEIVIGYLVIINLLTYITFAFDKARSRRKGRRVSEKKLWLLSLIGGSAGALAAMNQFRHKTKKISFQAVLSLILAGQVLLLYRIFFY